MENSVRNSCLLQDLAAYHNFMLLYLHIPVRTDILKTKKIARKNFNRIQRYKNSKSLLLKKQSEIQTMKKGMFSNKFTRMQNLFLQSQAVIL